MIGPPKCLRATLQQPVSDYRHLVDQELIEAALVMRETTAAFTPMTVEKLATRRAWMSKNAPSPRLDVPFSRQEIIRPGESRGPDVPVYVVNAKPGHAGPGLLHMHGGGFTASSALFSLPHVQTLALELGCPIVSVDYRLAPETTWSGSLDDNYTALRWLHTNAADIGIDPSRIGIVGESAGGGHAALEWHERAWARGSRDLSLRTRPRGR